jgi:hypothetical protein
MDGKTRTIAWLREDQADLMLEVARLAGLTFIGAGGPEKGRQTAPARRLEAEHVDDLRAALASADAELAVLAAPGPFGSSPEDIDALLSARKRGVRVAALEPAPGSALELAGGWLEGTGSTRAVDAVRHMPLARHGPVFRDALELLESFGSFRTLTFESWRSPAHGSLASALYGAADLVLSMMGEPERIDAAHRSLDRTMERSRERTLRDLSGEITANLRFADGRIAGIVAGDQGGRWERVLTLVGEQGRLRVHDFGYEWIGPDGRTVDSSERDRPDGDPAAQVIAEQLRWLLDPAKPAPAPSDVVGVYAIAQAALLSASTGAAESPATIRRLTTK